MKLSDRIEQLAGRDREVDAEAAVALDWRFDEWEEGEPTAKGMVEKHGMDWLVSRMDEGMSPWRLIPRYTASLDAAMSLVPEGWTSLELLAPLDAVVVWSAHFTLADGRVASGYGETRELAVVCAALRARGL